jgi:hypothetical protein
MEAEKAERRGIGIHRQDWYSPREIATVEHGSMVARWCWKVEAMRLSVACSIPRTVELTGNGGAWLWLNRTPHVLVFAPEPAGVLPWICEFEIGP